MLGETDARSLQEQLLANEHPDWEPALAFSDVELTPRKEVVRKFYKDMWDYADISLIPELFHEDFTFRGSLGPALVGYQQFADYVRWITGTFGEYTSDVLLMSEGDSIVSARLRFHGFHRKEVFGYPPTGKHVWWYGVPFITFEGTRIRDLWVLGDIHGLIGQISGSDPRPTEFRTASAR